MGGLVSIEFNCLGMNDDGYLCESAWSCQPARRQESDLVGELTLEPLFQTVKILNAKIFSDDIARFNEVRR